MLHEKVCRITCKLILFLAVANALQAKDKNRQIILPDRVVHTPYGDLRLTDLRVVNGILFTGISGVVHNDTSRTWSTLSTKSIVHTSRGLTVPIMTELEIFGLTKGQQVTFGPDISDKVFGITFQGRPKDITDFDITLDEQGSRYVVRYNISLLKPAAAKLLTYEDANFRFEFAPDSSQIAFVIQNKTEAAAKLDWNSAAFVGFDGKAGQITHSGVKYADASAAKPPSIIPPGAKFEDAAVPVANIQRDASGWSTRLILFDGPFSSRLIDKTFGLLIPLSVNDNKTDYFFQFHVDSVD